ncbi:hypothetical protein PV325_002716 [Microctonus aethiopoides]|nr:hypothetical protein PV325_002716 [Microctonus aethiopoides]
MVWPEDEGWCRFRTGIRTGSPLVGAPIYTRFVLTTTKGTSWKGGGGERDDGGQQGLGLWDTSIKPHPQQESAWNVVPVHMRCSQLKCGHHVAPMSYDWKSFYIMSPSN